MGIHKALLYEEQGEKISLTPLEAISVKAHTLLAIVERTLVPTKLEIGVNTVVYNPKER